MDPDTSYKASSRSEYFIQNIVGCGRFQVLLIFLVYTITSGAAIFVMLFMSFGNYNPGWRCLDYNNTNDFVLNDFSLYHNASKVAFEQENGIINVRKELNLNKTFLDYDTEVFENDVKNNNMASEKDDFITDNCTLFNACQNIQFHPDTNSIVTEWKLLCGDKWIPSTIISFQMAGLFLGSLIAGYVGDTVGRKKTIYGSQSIIVILSVVSMFSSSWQMFAILRFFLGFATAGIMTFYYVYMVEFVTVKWRAPLVNVPIYALHCVFFALVCMWLKDWRQIHLATAILSFVGLFPVLWLPESLRWLEVKEKENELKRAMAKICRLNGKALPINSLMESNQLNRKLSETKPSKTENYSYLFLFRIKAYRLFTILLTIPWFSMSIIFYALSFGVKALSGDFYINLIIMYVVDVPFTLVTTILPNLIGRKLAAIILSGVTTLCLLIAGIVYEFTEGHAKTIGVLLLVMLGRIAMGDFWGMMMLITAELYPTDLRGLGTGWGNTVARLGGIVAPFLIPNQSDTFLMCYMILAGLSVVCCLVVSRLPETRGKELTSKATSIAKDASEDAGTATI